jgi:hypothetical protein
LQQVDDIRHSLGHGDHKRSRAGANRDPDLNTDSMPTGKILARVSNDDQSNDGEIEQVITWGKNLSGGEAGASISGEKSSVEESRSDVAIEGRRSRIDESSQVIGGKKKSLLGGKPCEHQLGGKGEEY